MLLPPPPRCISQRKWHRNCASHRIDTCLSLQRSIFTPRWRESIPHTQGVRGRMPCVYCGIVIKGQRILLHLLPTTRVVWVRSMGRAALARLAISGSPHLTSTRHPYLINGGFRTRIDLTIRVRARVCMACARACDFTERKL